MGAVERISTWMKLTGIEGVGPKKLLRAIQYFGSVENIYNASSNDLIKSGLFNERMLTSLDKIKNTSDVNLRNSLDLALKKGIEIITITDERYPKKLLNVSSPPATLFMAGNLGLFDEKIIAIVGTRTADNNALEFTRGFVKDLVNKGYTIASGGALGIDAIAHKTALDSNGKTICVLGSGLDRVYPPGNIDLINTIKEKGLVISEHLPNFPGSSISFVLRNRITSGISEAVCLMASKEVGGAMSQTKIAFQQKRPIYCPDPNLRVGPNEGLKKAIQDYGAIPFKDVNDLERELNREVPRQKTTSMNDYL